MPARKISNSNSNTKKRSNNFNEKIVKNLIAHSKSNNFDEARKEWKYFGVITSKNQCNLCGHKIKTNIIIVNKKTGKTLNIGKVCAANILSEKEYYVAIDAFEEEEKKYKRIVDSLKLAHRFDIAGTKQSHHGITHKENTLMDYGLIPRRTNVSKEKIEKILNYYGFSSK